MSKPLFEFKKNDWVKVMMPNIIRTHCLSIIESEFAHAYCGRSFPMKDLVRVDEHNDGQRQCPSCAIKTAYVAHTKN